MLGHLRSGSKLRSRVHLPGFPWTRESISCGCIPLVQRDGASAARDIGITPRPVPCVSCSVPRRGSVLRPGLPGFPMAPAASRRVPASRFGFWVSPWPKPFHRRVPVLQTQSPRCLGFRSCFPGGVVCSSVTFPASGFPLGFLSFRFPDRPCSILPFPRFSPWPICFAVRLQVFGSVSSFRVSPWPSPFPLPWLHSVLQVRLQVFSVSSVWFPRIGARCSALVSGFPPGLRRFPGGSCSSVPASRFPLGLCRFPGGCIRSSVLTLGFPLAIAASWMIPVLRPRLRIGSGRVRGVLRWTLRRASSGSFREP